MLSDKNNKLTRVLTRIAIVIAILVGVSLPLGYTLIGYSDLSDLLTFKAKIKANAQNNLVTTLPGTWMFAENRINGILSREPVVLENEMIQIFDQQGELITSVGTDIKNFKIQRSYPLYDIDQIVGEVVVSASLTPLLINILWSILFGTCLGLLVFVVLRLLPIRALQHVSNELFEEKERAEATLHAISDAIFVTDVEGKVLYCNSPAEEMIGKSIMQLKNVAISKLLFLRDEETGIFIDSVIHETLRSGNVVTCDKNRMLEAPGHLKISVEERSTPLFDNQGNVSGGVLCLRDVTIAREYIERRTWEASHDLLTGLVNRREFEKRVAKAIEMARTSGSRYVVCCMDLDRFKVVNDTCGHAAGDDLLKEISRIMRSGVRERDTLARLGGDEFGLLIEKCDEAKGEIIANDLLSVVEQYQFCWEKQTFTVGVSIGLTTISQDSFSTLEVLGQADSACYWAKEQGRHRSCVFKENDMDLAARRSQTGWVGRIGLALKENRFVLYHQTYRSLNEHHGECLHLEVLLRMVAEDGEIILPNRFLPAAERYNLMLEVDCWVINEVFSGFKQLKRRYSEQEVMVNINLSGASINSLKLLDFIEDKIVKFDIDPTCLCFEVTETVAVKNMSAAIEFINACKKLGIKFALDDFGTGTSSFGYLKNLPVDYLKIDGGFVQNLEKDAVDRAMAETINRIGHIMGKVTIAEFAENQSIINILDDMGVDFAQGYGVCRPIPLFS